MSGYRDPAPSPPKFEVVPGYFVQDTQDPSALPPIPRRFGLLDEKTWYDVTSNLTSLRADADPGTSYILFFLGRHGQGYHNVGAENHPDDWAGVWTKQEGDADAYLTPYGEQQAVKARDAWKGELPFGIPVPDKMYCSPLTHALRTHEMTFGDVESPPTTLVLEDCREQYGVLGFIKAFMEVVGRDMKEDLPHGRSASCYRQTHVGDGWRIWWWWGSGVYRGGGDMYRH
ncbi:hypothetical protein APHAL10511_003377 [Amanita phalloides]|nr:hypothetical protein APHAL10511_003377 [Amanita phalloides]